MQEYYKFKYFPSFNANYYNFIYGDKHNLKYWFWYYVFPKYGKYLFYYEANELMTIEYNDIMLYPVAKHNDYLIQDQVYLNSAYKYFNEYDTTLQNTKKDKHNNIVDSSLTNMNRINIYNTIIDKCYQELQDVDVIVGDILEYILVYYNNKKYTKFYKMNYTQSITKQHINKNDIVKMYMYNWLQCNLKYIDYIANNKKNIKSSQKVIDKITNDQYILSLLKEKVIIDNAIKSINNTLTKKETNIDAFHNDLMVYKNTNDLNVDSLHQHLQKSSKNSLNSNDTLLNKKETKCINNHKIDQQLTKSFKNSKTNIHDDKKFVKEFKNNSFKVKNTEFLSKYKDTKNIFTMGQIVPNNKTTNKNRSNIKTYDEQLKTHQQASHNMSNIDNQWYINKTNTSINVLNNIHKTQRNSIGGNILQKNIHIDQDAQLRSHTSLSDMSIDEQISIQNAENSHIDTNQFYNDISKVKKNPRHSLSQQLQYEWIEKISHTVQTTDIHQLNKIKQRVNIELEERLDLHKRFWFIKQYGKIDYKILPNNDFNYPVNINIFEKMPNYTYKFYYETEFKNIDKPYIIELYDKNYNMIQSYRLDLLENNSLVNDDVDINITLSKTRTNNYYGKMDIKIINNKEIEYMIIRQPIDIYGNYVLYTVTEQLFATKHPIPIGKDLGLQEIALHIPIMVDFINILLTIWAKFYMQFTGYTGTMAIYGLVNVIYDWLMLETSQQEDSIQDYYRCYRWFRWECEKVYNKAKHDPDLHGNAWIEEVLYEMIDYMEMHHFNIMPIFENTINMDEYRNIFQDPSFDLEIVLNKFKGVRKRRIDKNKNMCD